MRGVGSVRLCACRRPIRLRLTQISRGPVLGWAARGFLAVELTLLVPAFIVAEATLSYVGRLSGSGRELGDDAARHGQYFCVRRFPWLLSPAAAMFLVVLGLNLLVQSDAAYTRAMKIGAGHVNRHEVRGFH
jgi:hypothetical protein